MSRERGPAGLARLAKPLALLALVVALAATSLSPAQARAGTEVGNGGGIAEKNVTFAYLSLDRYVDLCLADSLCRLNEREAETLRRIRASLGDERRAPGQLVFRSGKKNPGFFMIDGQVRVAKTGDAVGSPIYVNTDLLYADVGSPGHADFRPVELPLAASILVHELGHHQGVADHAYLDVLGSKLQALLLTQSLRSEFWNGQAVLWTFQFNKVKKDADKKEIRQLDQLLFEYGDELVNLTDRLTKAIRCPAPGQSPRGLRLYDVHEERGAAEDGAARSFRKPLQAWYILSCKDGEESDHGNLELSLSFDYGPAYADRGASYPSRFVFRPDRTQVRQVSCRDDSSACK